MMNYQFIPATAEDQSWLEQLRRAVYRDLFFATWGQWDEVRHLRHCSECWERGGIFCVEVDHQRVGMIQLLDHPKAIEIAEIQIAPAYQGRGIGTVLLRETIRSAHAKGKKVSLSTALMNHRAFALYVRLGCQQVGKTDTHNLVEFPPMGR